MVKKMNLFLFPNSLAQKTHNGCVSERKQFPETVLLSIIEWNALTANRLVRANVPTESLDRVFQRGAGPSPLAVTSIFTISCCYNHHLMCKQDVTYTFFQYNEDAGKAILGCELKAD